MNVKMGVAGLLCMLVWRPALAMVGASKGLIAPAVQLAPDVGDVRAYPNPWRSDRNAGRNVTFDRFKGTVTIHIFTVAAEPVKTLTSSNGRSVMWDLTNDAGATVASGVYLYMARNADGEKAVGKLAVIR